MSFPVELQPVAAKRVDYMVSAVGTVDAFERVQVAARVAGAIERVAFTEGEFVAQGQPLVYIDTERYRIAVQAARATLERAEASRNEAQAGLNRRKNLAAQQPNLMAVEELDSWQAKAQVSVAAVAEARAALAKADLDARNATPGAPAAGIIETRNVATGQYVQLGTPLATLVRRDPLLLKFKVTEAEASALTIGMRVTFATSLQTKSYTAHITHISQSAEPASRLVATTAEIDDPAKAELRPGTFAQVTLVVGGRDTAPVVPQIAVRPCERGFVAYVIEEGVAHERIVTLGMRTPEGLIEVKAGLTPGEQVVVRGAEALSDGAHVTAKPMASAATPAATSPQPKVGAEATP